MNGNIRKVVIGGALLAIGLILPFVTGQIPVMGNMLLPMHIPVLLCGYWCGWQYGLLVGFVLPLFRSLLFGMPALFPTAAAMAVELAVYGMCIGIFGRRLGRSLKGIYLSLIGTMVVGRIAWGMASGVLYHMAGSAFSWKIFWAQGITNAIPGILLQLILIPVLIKRIPLDIHLPMKPSCIKRFEPVVKAIYKLEKKVSGKPILIALDGKCASGKTTLGYYLKKEFDANLFHLDDFFLQMHQRTTERLAEVGGNVDYERFYEEVVKPVLAEEGVKYRRFDCGSMQMTEAVEVAPKRINIIEGSYSQHPYFGDIYDLKVFTDIDEESQIENIRKRNGEEKVQIFRERWIPKEEAYFETFKIKEKSDIIVEWSKRK